MGFYRTVVATLVSTLLAAIILGVFQPSLDRWLNNERLDAIVYPAPWQPYGDEPDLIAKRKAFLDRFSNTFNDHEQDYRADRDYNYSFIRVENNSGKTITDVRIKFAHRIERVNATYADGSRAHFEGVDVLKLPDFLPGEIVIVAAFDTISIPGSAYHEIKTYSSAGPFDLAVARPVRSVLDLVFSGPWEFAKSIVTLYVILVCIFAPLSFFYQDRYTKALLRDGDFWLGEHDRYSKDPKSFAAAKVPKEVRPKAPS